MICIELCAGSAKLSAALATQGFKVVAVDYARLRSRQCHPCITLDLSSEEGYQYIESLLSSGMVLYFHVAPPCGTLRRQAKKKALQKLQRRPKPQSQPLRSSEFPAGLPNLAPQDKSRVDRANAIYDKITRLIRVAIRQNVLVTVESPSKALLWETPWFASLAAQGLLHEVTFQECMWGGRKDQWYSWCASDPSFDVLHAVCDQQHEHQPQWRAQGKPPYPPALCDKVANLVYQAALQAGAQAVSPEPSAKRTKTQPHTMAAAGRQPRGERLPPIISEFKYITTSLTDLQLDPKPDKKLSIEQCRQLQVPHPSKLLQFTVGKEEGGGKQKRNQLEIGVWRTPEEFMHEASKLQHPFDDDSSVDDSTKLNIYQLFTEGVGARARKAEVILGYYEKRARELQEDEDFLHEQLDEVRKKIVEGKRFLLFHEMCQDAGLQGEELHHLQLQGVQLTGVDQPTELFKPVESRPAITKMQLMKSSKWSRKVVLRSTTKSVQDAEVRQAVWEVTQDELAKGWLQGPFSEAEVRRMLGPLFVVSKRFGLVQTDKVRQIDNLSESLVNSAFAASYKLDLDGIDGISVLARCFAESVTSDGFVQIRLSDGSVRRGKLHSSFSVSSARSIGGRTLDLEAAYKQVLVAKSSLWCNVLAVEDPSGVKRLYISHVLPFGASASVYNFNKISRSIQLVGSALLGLVWGNYYDDYLQLDVLQAQSWAQDTAERFLNLIGWKFSSKPTKRQPLNSVFSALGVTFDLRQAAEGLVIVKNKESRVSQLLEDLSKFTKKGQLTESEAATFMGRLQFAESQTYGRAVSLHMKVVRQRACGKQAGMHISEDMLAEFRWATEFLRNDHPRILRANTSRTKLVVFTDAALEGNSDAGSVGMVALWIVNGKVENKYFFSERVPDSTMRLMQSNTKKVIAGLELLAGIVSIYILRQIHVEGRTFLFVDNEAARASAISMNSSVETHCRLLKFLSLLAEAKSLFLWIARVPSASNPADDPSRLIVDKFVREEFTRLTVPWTEVNEWLAGMYV